MAYNEIIGIMLNNYDIKTISYINSQFNNFKKEFLKKLK